MTKKLIYVLCLLVTYLNFYAQEIELKGKIQSSINENASINIINLTQKKGSISDANGNFSVSVALNDTLVFSAVQFEKLDIIVTQEIIENSFLNIQLIEKNTLLREVVINPYGLSGNLERDAQNMPSYTFNYKAAGLLPPKKPRTQSERRLYTASSTSVDYIINSINGRIKKLRQLNEWSKLDELKNDIQERLPLSFFTKDLGIKEEYVEDFIYFCLENQALKSYLQHNEDLEIIEYLSLKSNAYQILKSNETVSN